MSDFGTAVLEFEPTDTLVVCMEALVEGKATAEQHVGLGRVLAADPLARKWFIDYMQLHASLTWDAADLGDASAEVAPLGQVSPVLGFLNHAYHGTIGSLPSAVAWAGHQDPGRL